MKKLNHYFVVQEHPDKIKYLDPKNFIEFEKRFHTS